MQIPMADFRTEKDSLGEVNVPANARYGAQTQRAKDNFSVSDYTFPAAFIAAHVRIKRAAARVNLGLGILDQTRHDAILKACDAILAGSFADQFPLDIYQTGSGTSTNMNVNEVVASVANDWVDASHRIHPNDHVNMSQSSNDTIPTSMHISAACELKNTLIPALQRFQRSLAAKAQAFDHVVKSGRTHLMDATPVRLGQEFAGYEHQVKEGMRRVEQAIDELLPVALGGTAVGTGINCPPTFAKDTIALIAQETGIAFRESENHFEAQGTKDGFVSAHGHLQTLAVSLLKIANDIRHLSSGPTSGLSEISLPSIQPGSSIMPGKVNPVMSEAMMMVSARVMGNQTTMVVGGQHSNFELNVMMPVMAHAMLESIQILSGVLDSFRVKCLDGIEANEARCKELLERNPAIATALNRTIGYDLGSKVAKKAAAEGRSVRDVVLELGLLSESQLDELLNVRNMTEPGIPG